VKKEIERFFLLRVAPTLLFFIMRLFWFSYKKRYHFLNKPLREQLIAVSWHGELFISPQMYRKLYPKERTSAIISKHRDGEFIARVLNFFKIMPVRGSTNKGAFSALIDSIKVLKRGENLLITPDGPRGPRHFVSAGAVALAIKQKLPIMIVSFRASSYWQLKSWDKFVVPKPFSRVDIYYQTIRVQEPKDRAIEQLRELMLNYSIR
jgi:lysophospholipid acyltransferase (LPLAT)-like uncharacterized protein